MCQVGRIFLLLLEDVWLFLSDLRDEDGNPIRCTFNCDVNGHMHELDVRTRKPPEEL